MGDLSLVTGNSPNLGINTSVPYSSVKGRGGKKLNKEQVFRFVALSEFQDFEAYFFS